MTFMPSCPYCGSTEFEHVGAGRLECADCRRGWQQEPGSTVPGMDSQAAACYPLDRKDSAA